MIRWKQVELAFARILGGQRVPITGRQRGDVPDIRHPWLSIEVKTRRHLPAWIEDGMKQAEAAQETHQLPVLILHKERQPYKEAIIGMRIRDFLEWFNYVPPELEEENEEGTDAGG